MSDPSFFSEGSEPRRSDTQWKIEQKILGALDSSGGIFVPTAGGTMTGPLHIQLNGLDTDPDGALFIENTTAAAAGAQQYSPATIWTGRGWKTNATAGSQQVDMRAYLVPVQGAAAPYSQLVFEPRVNLGTWGGTVGRKIWFTSDGWIGLNSWNSGTTGESGLPDGIHFKDPAGSTIQASIYSWGNHHGGVPNTPELIMTSNRSMAIAAGLDAQKAIGSFGWVQLGVSSDMHDIFYFQADDAIPTVGWDDYLGSAAAGTGHSKIVQWRASVVGGITAHPGIMGHSLDGATLATGYDEPYGRLRFYTVTPTYTGDNNVSGYGGFMSKPGIWVGEMRKDGWNFRGRQIRERTLIVADATTSLDFSVGEYVEILGSPANVLFATTGDTGTENDGDKRVRNAERRVFIFKANGVPTNLSYPAAWTIPSALPAALAADELLRLEIESLGTGESNKIVVSAVVMTDNSYEVDTDADGYFTRASITDDTQKSAVNQLTRMHKASGVWTKIDFCYPYVGGTGPKHSHNLKSASYQLTWAGTPTHNANGITGNGTDAYGDTGFVPSTAGGNWTLNSAHLFVYCGTQTPTDTKDLISAQVPGNTNASLRVSSFALQVVGLNNNSGALSHNVSTDFRGPLLATRIGASEQHFFGRSGIGKSRDTGAATALPSVSIYVLARNTGSGADRLTNANLRGAQGGGGLTQAQAIDNNYAWEIFEQILQRQSP